MVSVIIPVYNAENYLERCLHSVLKQTRDDYEVILVDDGSKDKSSDICDSFAEKYDKVSVVHQKNAGVGAARNVGISVSKGEWIMFCDADDIVEENWIEVLSSYAMRYPEWLVNCEYLNVNLLTGYTQKAAIPGNNGKEPCFFNKDDYFLFFKYGYSPYVWCRCFCADIIRKFKIEFSVDIKAEDVLFILDYLKYTKGFCYIPSMCYKWVNNDNDSESRRYDPEYYKLISRLYFCRKPFISEKYMQDYYNIYFYYFYQTLKSVFFHENSQWTRWKKCKEILGGEAFIEVLKMADKQTCGKKLRFILSLRSFLILKVTGLLKPTE